MKIQILGSGCKSCKKLYDNANDAASESGIEFEMEKISDFSKIAEMGVLKTPALAIDGVVKSSGRVIDKTEIKKILEQK